MIHSCWFKWWYPESPRFLWWPPGESHYNVYDHSAVGYVIYAHCIVLLYAVGNEITTTTTTVCNRKIEWLVKFMNLHVLAETATIFDVCIKIWN